MNQESVTQLGKAHRKAVGASAPDDVAPGVLLAWGKRYPQLFERLSKVEVGE